MNKVLGFILLLFVLCFASNGVTAQQIKSADGQTVLFVLKGDNILEHPNGMEAFRFSNDSIYAANNFHSFIRKEEGKVKVYDAYSNFFRGHYIVSSGSIYGYKNDYRGMVDNNGNILDSEGQIIARSSGIDKQMLGCLFLILW